MENINKYVIGIDKPIKRNPLYKCGFCLPNKMSKASHKSTTKQKNLKRKKDIQDLKTPIKLVDNPGYYDDIQKIDNVAGQHFHMDFGFVRGSNK